MGNKVKFNLKNVHAAKLTETFHALCDKYGIVRDNARIFGYLHEFPEHKGYEQLKLFD